MLLAILTTLLWSGSYIVNKWAFAEGVGPLSLSGIRYTLAGVILSGIMKKGESGKPLPLRLALLQGLVCFGLGQGCQYVGQSLLNPTLASLVLNAGMVLFILLADWVRLKETPRMALLWKVGLLVAGMAAYYYPWGGGEAVSLAGLCFMLLAAFGSAMNVVCNRLMLVRGIQRRSLTIRPMLLGGVMMLTVGLLTERLPRFSWALLGCVVYLVVFSGALGFSLWVYSQQRLTAMESGCVNNAMLIEIALLDVICFGRVLGLWQWIGIGTVFVAITVMNHRKAAKPI